MQNRTTHSFLSGIGYGDPQLCYVPSGVDIRMQLGITMGDSLSRLIERQIDNLPYVETSRVTFASGTPTVLVWNQYAILNSLTITQGT